MANGNPKDVAEEYGRLASRKYRNARRYLVGSISLFLSTLAAVAFAEKAVELTIVEAEASASAIVRDLAITKEQLEEVQLWQGEDFNGIAVIRDGKTAAVAGSSGIVMISDGERRSWIKVPSNTGRYIYGIALSDNGETAVAVGASGLILISSDGGETWMKLGNIVAEDINGVALSGDGKIAVAVGGRGSIRVFLRWRGNMAGSGRYHSGRHQRRCVESKWRCCHIRGQLWPYPGFYR